MITVPVNLLTWSAAVCPIAALLVLMIRFQWGATKAAPTGLLITILNAVVFYKADAFVLAIESLKGLWSATSILIVVWPAILLFEATKKAGAYIIIRNEVKRILPNELIQFLMFAWVFVSFLQGITGFGVPVAVGAPLLIGIGVAPLWSVIIPIIGNSWANTFGTLALAWRSLVQQADLQNDIRLLLKTALYSALSIWIWNLISGIAICWFYGKLQGIRKGLPAVAFISFVQGGGQLLLSQADQTLAAFLPSCLALVVCFLLGKTAFYNYPWRLESSPIMVRQYSVENNQHDHPDMGLSQAFLPYSILTLMTLTVLLISPLKSFLERLQVSFSFPKSETGYGFINEAIDHYSPLSPFTHASMFLFCSAVIGILYFRKHQWLVKTDIQSIMKESLKKTLPTAVTVIGFLVMSRIMSGTGQTMVLAKGIASVLGKKYSLLAPFIGMLGSFLTGSNMASNILFGKFQMTTAQLLQMNIPAILGAQTAGGAIGTTVSPSGIILGTTTISMRGKEGEVLRKTLPLALFVSVLLGILLYLSLPG